MRLLAFYCIVSAGVISCNRLLFSQSKTKNIELIVTLFRHGNRTSQVDELYPKDPYLNVTYNPFGNGQLTNTGKRKEYLIGNVLRKRYGKFLGRHYSPGIVDARSTDYNRTKMSLLLVLGSLFPPTGVERWKWNLYWQPIPYNYEPRNTDRVLMGYLCPNYTKLYNNYIKTPKIQSIFNKYKETFSYISENTGLNVTILSDVYNLYFGLSTESEWGFKLPDWTNSVWPTTITDLAIQEYSIQVGTTDLIRMTTGFFLQKVLNDIKAKLAGKTPMVKIYLYSAHENNIADVLLTLGVYPYKHIPTYGSYITFEVHKLQGNHSGIKLLYANDKTSSPMVLQLPRCSEICELGKFEQLITKYIPADDLCGN